MTAGRSSADFVTRLLPLILLAGCAAPREHIYALADAGQLEHASSAQRLTVLLTPFTIPEEEDRPQIVVREGPYQLTVNEQARWSAPLKTVLPQMIAAELNKRSPDRRFAAPGHAVGAVGARMAIDVVRFEVYRRANATVSAHWVYRPSASSDAWAEGDASGRTAIVTDSYEGMVDALRLAIAGLSEQIVAQLPGT